MKDYSMGSHKRRSHQRWLNAYIRMWNKVIEDDDLWMGRFVVEQKRTHMHWFDDNSGGILYCHLQFRDKKTGRTKDWYTSALEVDHQLGWKFNEFIVNDCAVWEKENPRQERKDYRNVR